MAGDLIVSVSGISDRTLDHLEDFRGRLDARGVPLSLFVAPRRKHGYRLDEDDTTADWLRRQQAGGDAIVLHGFDEAATKRRRGEFAVLPAHEAGLRLIAADRMMERIGLRTRLFAAPGWTVSPGAARALPRNGFRLLVGRQDTRDLVTGTAHRAPVVGIGAGLGTESWRCRTVVLTAERTARRGGDVRLAIAAGQLGREGPRQAVIDAVDLALMHGCAPAVYRWAPGPALSGVA